VREVSAGEANGDVRKLKRKKKF